MRAGGRCWGTGLRVCRHTRSALGAGSDQRHLHGCEQGAHSWLRDAEVLWVRLLRVCFIKWIPPADEVNTPANCPKPFKTQGSHRTPRRPVSSVQSTMLSQLPLLGWS